MAESSNILRIGTRGSVLARAQTMRVVAALRAIYGGALRSEERVFVTQGDRVVDRPLPELGGKGLFTAELDAALQHGEIDAAVHSLKDLPVEADAADGALVLGAVCERDAVHDVLISSAVRRLEDLPEGATVGTSSLRRRAQLLVLRPDLTVAPIRGNIDTRIRKIDEGLYAATALAACGLDRLGISARAAQTLDLNVMLPAPGQGAVAVQCRRDDVRTRELLARLDDVQTRREVFAERAFLRGLGGGCSLPVAAYACSEGDSIRLHGRVCAEHARDVLDEIDVGDDPLVLGERLAQRILARGGQALLVPPRSAEK